MRAAEQLQGLVGHLGGGLRLTVVLVHVTRAPALQHVVEPGKPAAPRLLQLLQLVAFHRLKHTTDFVGKHVKGFDECAPFNDLALLTDVYKGTAGGAGIIQLQDGPPRVVDDIYKVLLRPKGRCWGCAPTDLTCLKAAVRGALTGLATLHSAGKCSAQGCREGVGGVSAGSNQMSRTAPGRGWGCHRWQQQLQQCSACCAIIHHVTIGC